MHVEGLETIIEETMDSDDDDKEFEEAQKEEEEDRMKESFRRMSMRRSGRYSSMD